MAKLDPVKCSEMVPEKSRWGFLNRHQCEKKVKVTRDGKSYCKIHDPEYIAAQKKTREARWQKKWEEEKAYTKLHSARLAATEGLTLEELEKVTPGLIRKALEVENG